MKYLIIPVLLGLGLAGCSQAKSDEAIAEVQQSGPSQQQLAAISAAETQLPQPAAAQPEMQAGPSEIMATAKVQPGHSVAYQAELKVAVDDFDKATDRINALLEQHGAYLGTAHESRADGQRRQEMTLQVPPRQFMTLVSALGKLGRIENKDITSADITADVLATAAQLDQQQAAETLTRQKLAQAATPAERARLEDEARRQRLETGATQTQLQQFGARANWASLTLRYYQVLPATETTVSQPPMAPRFRQAFSWSWTLVLELALGLAYAWPVLLLAALAGWGLHRWRLRQAQAA